MLTVSLRGRGKVTMVWLCAVSSLDLHALTGVLPWGGCHVWCPRFLHVCVMVCVMACVMACVRQTAGRPRWTLHRRAWIGAVVRASLHHRSVLQPANLLLPLLQ